MGSVPDNPTIQRCRPIVDDAVRQIALENALPWHLHELKMAAFHGLQAAFYDRTDSLGLPFEQ